VIEYEGKCGENVMWKLDGGLLTINGSGDMWNFALLEAPWKLITSSIETVVIEDRVTSIGNNSFAYCVNLKTVIIAETVVDIGGSAFYGDSNLTSVFYLGSRIISTPSSFNGCMALQSMCVPPDYHSPSFCGVNITTCESFQSMFNYCTKAVYYNGQFVSGKRAYVDAWERRTNGCKRYFCNGSALVSENIQSCDNASACYSGICNEKTGKCEYNRVSGWENLEENECYEVVCDAVNNKWILKEKENVTEWISRTNGCVNYTCHNSSGLISEPIKSCDDRIGCYIGFCNESTGTCDYSETSDWEELKKEENHCYEVVCNGSNGWILQMRENASLWENRSSGCVKYVCNNLTGEEKIILSCNDAEACHVGYCNETTHQCEYVEKDGLEELKKQENKCYEVVCDENNEWSVQKRKEVAEWEDRKSKCKIYECNNLTGLTFAAQTTCDEGPKCHTGKCNETSGDCIYEKIAGYDELIGQENHCYEVACDGEKWILQKRQNATEWENLTDGCTQYQCHNELGPISWSICNSSRTVGNKCEDGQCVPVICPSGQYQFYGNCYNCSAVLSCATCSNATSCDSCKDGFILNANGTCQRDCSIYGNGCDECNAKRCLTCTKKECCNQMEYYWNKTLEVCQDPAEVFGIGCLKADDEKCTECTAATCCEDRQYFDYNTLSCDNCSKFGDDCSVCNAAGCMECDGDKIVGFDGASCMSCEEMFGDGCESCNKSTCLTVKEGYTLIRTVARKCTDLFSDKCTKCNPSGCEICIDGYKSFDGYCKSCSEVFGDGCSECSDTECTQCNSDRLTLINGVCADCVTAYGEGCIECNNVSSCTRHDVGYFIYHGYAVSCDVLPPVVQTVCYTDQTGEASMNFQFSRYVKNILRDNEDYYSTTVTFNGEDYSVYCNELIDHCVKCDSLTCTECEEGYVVYGSMCKKCSDIHDSCEKCSLTSCTDCSDNKVAVSGVCQNCESLNPHCSVCTPEGNCADCDEGFVEKDGMCSTCLNLYGAGCTECNSTECHTCTEDACCPDDTHIIVSGEERFCSTCGDLEDNCAECTSTQCLDCSNGMVLDVDDSYKCKECSELFFGCSECDSDKCKKCQNDDWLLTDNGCAYEEEEPEDVPSSIPDSSSSSSSKSSSLPDVSSQPIITPTSSMKASSEKSNAGMIAGIVVGCVVVVAIVAVTVYCLVTAGPKHGKVDSSFFEEDEDHFSMSVL